MPNSAGTLDLRVSPYPIIPPLKDTKRTETPTEEDGESKPAKEPTLLPDIGESHPFPYYFGPDVDLRSGRKSKGKKKVIPVLLPVEKKPEKYTDNFLNSILEGVISEYLVQCVHCVVWDCVEDLGTAHDNQKYKAKMAKDFKKYALDKETTYILGRKLYRVKTNVNWPERCEKSVDCLNIDVLSLQAHRLRKAKFTLENEVIHEFQKTSIRQEAAKTLNETYIKHQMKELKTLDSLETKKHPQRTAVKSW